MQIVHIANWCTWLAHTLCKGLIWNYKNCGAQPWLSYGILQALRWSWVYQVFFCFWLIHGFVLKFGNMYYFFFNFGWWYTLMKNKHQISLYLGLKKRANILQMTFSNGFSFKKNYCLSFCLSVFLSLCLSACVYHTFFTMFPSWYYHEIFRSDYQWQKWCLCKRSEVKSQGYRGQDPN